MVQKRMDQNETICFLWAKTCQPLMWSVTPPPHPAPLIFALCSRLCSVFCLCFFIIWMAADVTGPLMDRYECLLWQEDCCTIFLYWRWASSLNLVQLEDQWVNSATNNEQRHLIGLLFSRWTTAILYIKRRDGRDLCGFATRWVAHLIIATRSLCASPPPRYSKTADTLIMWFSTTLSVHNTVCPVCWCMYDLIVHNEILKVHVPPVMSVKSTLSV